MENPHFNTLKQSAKIEFVLILVEAWSKVGLRGYHSGQKTVEQSTMKVQIIVFPRRGESKRESEERQGCITL